MQSCRGYFAFAELPARELASEDGSAELADEGGLDFSLHVDFSAARLSVSSLRWRIVFCSCSVSMAASVRSTALFRRHAQHSSN